MTKRIYEISVPDDLGPMWMNQDNLLACLVAYCPNTSFLVNDITDYNFRALPPARAIRADGVTISNDGQEAPL